MSGFMWIVDEATRIRRESGRPARYLLLSSRDYVRLRTDPAFERVNQHVLHFHDDPVETLERYIDLRIVVDPNRQSGPAVLGDAYFESRTR